MGTTVDEAMQSQSPPVEDGHIDSDDDGSVLSDPPDDDAPTPKPTNGTRSASSSTTAREEEESADAAGGRRKSGRVVRKPIKLADEAPSSTPSGTAIKRKRSPVEPTPAEEEGDASGESAAEDGEDGAEEDGDEDDDDEDEDAEEEEDEDEEESAAEDDEPDEEELREKRRAAKKKEAAKKATAPAAKKARTESGAVTTAAAPNKRIRKTPTGTNGSAAKPGKKGRPKVLREKRPEGDKDSVLFDAVMDADNLDTVANEWTVKYEEENMESMRNLVNFFLRCCGCEHSVTLYDIEDQDTAATTLSQIQDVFKKQQSPDYPIISKRPEFRGFRKRLSDFMQSLIAHITARELLYTDPALIENIQVWITAMSSSSLRPFRHTSTIISFHILTTLCDTASELRKANIIATRQVEAEDKKGKKNQGRIQALEEKLKEGEERKEIVEGVIKDIFDAVFVHRYRDIDPKIRADCVHDLATWILKLPDLFFDGTYLRYLGWVLSDTSALTRAEVIKSLSRIFKNKDNISGMRNFTERFRPRLVEMATRDAESSVRAMTVELLDVVREVGFLEPSDVDTVGRLLFDSDARVRKAVVGFFVKNIEDLYEEKIEDLGGQEAVEEGMASVDESDEEYPGPRTSWVKLKCLVEALASYDEGSEDGESGAESQGPTAEKLGAVVREGAAESRFSLAGAALWESFSEVQDWEGIARYLLFDHSAALVGSEEGEATTEELIKRTCALDPKEEVILLEVLNASVAAALVAGEGVPQAQAAKKGGNKKTKKPDGNSQEYVSRSLSKLIPPLLKKFGPVPDAASTVLRLEQLMRLDVYTDLRQSNAYASLLDDINRQFLTHADESVLKEASAALLHAKTFEELDEVTGEKLGQLQEETVAVLVACVNGKDATTARFGDRGLTDLINTVRRLEYLAGITDCREMLETPPISTRKGKKTAVSVVDGGVVPVDILLALLGRETGRDELEEELLVRVLKLLLFYFMWKVHALSAASDGFSEQDIEDLRHRKQTMVSSVGKIVSGGSGKKKGEKNGSGEDAVKVSAASTLLDVFTLFATLRGTGNATSEEDGGDRLAGFAGQLPKEMQRDVLGVFTASEKKFAKVSGKNYIPPSTDGIHDSDNDSTSSESEEEEEEEGHDETVILTHEQRLCELTGKIALAILSGSVDEKRFTARLVRNKGRLGASYREIVSVLENVQGDGGKAHQAPAHAPGKKPGRKPAALPGGKLPGDGDLEDRIVVGRRPSEEDEEEEHEEEEEEVEEAEADAEGAESPRQEEGEGDGDDDDNEMGDAAAAEDADGDQEMADA
ncbi:hypothetical protein DFH27DRAFT_996 [Peziza echinospora]|nr:hypothetical protein DFH27DRAFT_996 [Peziza echinospora]